MEQKRRIIATRVLVCAILLVLSVSAGAVDLAEPTNQSDATSTSVTSQNTLLDRFSFKTNAFEWLVTIPNFGVEFDLSDSEYNNMSVGLTAKYNWNTYHKYDSWSMDLNPGPPAVFNILDIRPEFRYYYRSVKLDPRKKNVRKFDIDRILKERKKPRPWRAQWVGAYVNYGNYTLKFGKRGYQGQVFGFGASTGYALPMYEYKKGFIDVELGFSVGLQLATRDVFVHNPDGFIYMHVTDPKESKGIHMTPYPVVSELRVAFAWRTKSIKDKVKTDTDRKRVKTYYETRVKPDRLQPLLDLNKEAYDTYLTNVKSPWELRKITASDSLYRAGFDALLKETADREVLQISSAFPSDMEQHERQDIRDYVQELKIELQELIAKTSRDTKKKFEKDYGAVLAEKAKAEALAAKEKAAAEAQSGEAAPEGEKPAKKAKPDKVKAEKVKEPKPEKVEKPKKEKAPKKEKDKEE